MDTDRLLRELSDFLRIPSISTSASHAADCRAAAEWVAGELRRLGCREVQFLASDTHPVVWGVGPEVPGAPTLLVYGHYDVQPPDPLDEWSTPPFEPTVRGDRLFARGAADDKGQVFCLLKAIEANGTPSRPPVNFRFLIEGEEEYGSRVLFELLRREPERTRADAVLIADMAYVAPRWPAVYTTLRGLCYAEITVRTAKSDLHSGEFGGAAPNAHEELVRLLARLKTQQGGARDLEEPPVQGGRVPEAPGAGARPDGAQSVFRARALVGAPDLRDPRHPGGVHRRWGEDGDPGGGESEGEPASRARPKAQGGGAPAHGRRQAAGAQVRAGEHRVSARRRPRDRQGHPPVVQAARSGVPGGGGAGHGARAGGGLDPGGPGAGPERGARHPHRHRLARRPAARAQRKAGSQAVMGRNPCVSKILR